MNGATFIYGYDPICGWCYGAAPAVRAVAQIMPVRIVMSGLVTGTRVGPAAAMESYVRGAATQLEAVTGRAPSNAFYAWMQGPGAMAASAPPAVAVHAVMKAQPDRALAFANAVTEAHYSAGMDPNNPDAYAALLAEHAPGVSLPDIHDPELANEAFEEGRHMGVKSFPTFLVETDGKYEPLATIYDPDGLVRAVQAIGEP